eukprot:m.45965 g.45965  ORF g.45965 m.45965 type:complete len:417 (-) comp20108_c0_seq1:275-1525(-)
MSGQAAYQLACKVQQYAWGKVGSNSTVAQFAQAGDKDFVLDEASPYAELWMGMHPKSPSQINLVDGSQLPLGDWILKNPWALSERIAAKFEGHLPFLFKVLSVNTALSIQAHPNKILAKILRDTDPAHYADDNHKPEMTIALTPFEGMCGFRPVAAIAKFFKEIPEFKESVGEPANALIDAVDGSADAPALKEKLKACFAGLMRCSADVLKPRIQQLAKSYAALKTRSTLQDLFLRLDKQYPGGDVGCFCVFFLNVVQLSPGDAMFLGPNEPHAYLFGDCVECMATSDNVVRAGLTPKFKDVDRLIEMLTYIDEPGDSKKFRGIDDKDNVGTSIYRTPVDEFDVAFIKYPAQAKQPISKIDGPSIFIVTGGEGNIELTPTDSLAMSKGTVFFVPAGAAPPISAGDQGLEVFRAFAE